ncbi:MAG: DNA repair protein RecO [Gemmataceae bacterium]|nr:DNA repair protein RecO [Gemmata sp.]MDW8196664.1 DNA repair protein RecO [Gemmataceae bacterium]
MPAEPAVALVVRGTDWSETSRILTLFTREFGKVRALAKGGRRIRSNFEMAFDLLSVCRVMIWRKSHGSLDLITEARLEEQFAALRTDLHALHAGYYIAELLADGTQDYDPHPILFDHAMATLRRLSGRNVLPAISVFELVWLRELGYSPRLDACAACGTDLAAVAEPLHYSAAAGGTICPACLATAPDRRRLSREALTTLWRLAQDGSEEQTVPIVNSEVRSLLGYTVSHVLGRRPRTLSYVDGR